MAHQTAVLCALGVQPGAASPDPVSIQPDVVYGHKDGMALTFDVLRPPSPNGAGVLFIPTGGWYSTWQPPTNWLPGCRPLLERGFTVLLVYHGSAPRYVIPEQVEDVRRCVRYVRLRARELGLDAERLGVMGGSAGGHLTLMLATTSDEGDPNAEDEVLRQPCRIAAAVAYCPPTDIRAWVPDPPEPIQSIPELRPPLSFDPAKAAECSPALRVTPRTAPTLLVHGDADELVPVEHSYRMKEALAREGVRHRLLVLEGTGHGFTEEDNRRVVPAMLEWFVEHLGEAS